MQALGPAHHRRERRRQGQTLIEQAFRWVTGIDYHGHALQWLECQETLTHTQSHEQTPGRFVHLTNLEVTAATVALISRTGRLRWVIENQGFNTQKHHGSIAATGQDDLPSPVAGDDGVPAAWPS